MLRKIKIWLTPFRKNVLTEFGVLVLIGIVDVTVCSILMAQEVEFKVRVGPQEEVLRPYSFGLTDFPDGLMGVVRKDGVYHWFIGSFPPGYDPERDRAATYLFRFIGDDLSKMKPDPVDKKGNALAVLSPGSAGSFDDQIAGNGSVYFDEKTGKLFFWWQAMQEISKEVAERKVKKLGGKNVYAAYGTIGLAVSEDMGRTWKKLGVVLKLNLPWDEFIENDEIGLGDSFPPVVVRNGDFLYMYYGDYLQPPDYSIWNLAIARLPLNDLHKTPQPWKKYYNGEFTEQAFGGKFSDINPEGVLEFPAVSFNTYVKQWIMLHVSYGETCELALRTSKDGIIWSKPKIILEASNPTDQLMHPTIIGTGNDPAITEQEFWIYYAFAPNKREYPPGGWMVRRKVWLEKKLDLNVDN